MSFFRQRRRPRWWPANQPWPPQRKRSQNHPFLRRLGCVFFLFPLGLCASFTWLGYVIGRQWDPTSPYLYIPLVVFAVVTLSVIVRVLRSLAFPLDDLVNAAGKVEQGDYTTRVRERCARELRDLTRAFNSMIERLQTNEQQRRNLLADVTHELRTPVAIIKGNLEGLLDGVYPADEDHLAPILEETRVLSRLIDDLRTLSLAESGALKLHRELTDLAVLINEAAASFRSQSDAKGIDLRVEIPNDLPLIEIDPVRIREVLTNLIANALRHTASGGVTVSAALAAKNVEVSVSDTGEGISPDDLPRIFDRFYKSKDSRGSGLGLAIAKNLVAMHGGEITAQSEVGRGAVVRFTLPVADGK